MSSFDIVKTPEAKRDSSSHGDDHKDHASDTDPNYSAARAAKQSLASPNVESLKNIQFIEPAEGTPAALALAANAAIKVTKFEKGLHKFRGLKRPKMKSLNIVKKINKTTKNKRKKRHFSKNFKGKVIDGVHELYTLTAGMMLGINHVLGITVMEESHEPNREASPEDFHQVIAVPFPAKGSTEGEFITPPHKLVHTFNFKSYAPRIFSKIRHLFDVDVTSYQQSVCGDYNYVEFISNSKSGQFFFYSHDGRYMLKTQTKEENRFLLSILPQYYEYLRENPNSLLVRILGMHRINMYHLRRKVHFVIMASVFDTPAKIHSIYDLKGSLTGREATPEEREGGGVLKDMDLLRDKRKFHLGPKKPEFIAQLRRDAEFLAKMNIMDYSLLVGIHYRSQRPPMEPVVMHPSYSSTTHPSLIGSEKNLHTLVPPVPPPTTGGLPHSNLPFRRGSIQSEEHGLHDTLTSDSENLASPPTIQAQRRASSRRMSATVKDSNNNNTNNPNNNGTTTNHNNNSNIDSLNTSNAYRQSPGRPMSLHNLSNDGPDAHAQPTQPSTTASSNNSQSTSRVLFPDNKPPSNDAAGSVTNSSAPPSQRSSLADNTFTGINPLPKTNSTNNSSSNVLSTGANNQGTASAVAHLANAVHATSVDDVHMSVSGTASAAGGVGSEDGEGDEDGDGEDDDEYYYGDGDEDEFEDIDEGDSDREESTSASAALGINQYINNTTNIRLSTSSNPPHHHHRKRRPWTDRVDLGINSHTREGRGDEIYYVGVIDILQQYNVQKRFETMVKGIIGDVRKISAIDAPSYGRRFVKFMDDNTD